MAAVLAIGGLNLAADAQEEVPPAAVDVAKLAREFAAANPARSSERVIALVSLGMPPQSLRRLARSAGVAGIPLILRGLKDNSVRQTIAALGALDPDPAASWQVDPRLFRALKANAVPVIAVVGGADHLVVRGDVPLAYALAKLAREEGPLAATAMRALRRLEAASPSR